MLGIIAAAALATQELATGRRIHHAREIARNGILERTIVACAATGAWRIGHPGGFEEHLRVDAVGLTRVVSDSVEFTLPRGRASRVVLRTATLCAS
jgi:hypothetical protein